MNLRFETTTHADADTLVQMRIAAMRESLERIGRFDPQRARDRFLASFEPELCRFIVIGGVSVGFVLTRPEKDFLKLEHFYVIPEHQGKGIGSMVMKTILADADADACALQVKLGALRDSDSNRFYQRHGFVKEAEDEWDIYYARQPQ